MKLTEKKLNVRSIILVTVILPVLVILVSSIAIVFTAKTVQPGSVFTPPDNGENAYLAPETEEEALDTFSALLKNAAESGILKYSGKTFAELRDITAKNEAVGKLFSQISGSFNSRLEGFYEEKAIKYGEDASFIISLLPESIPDSFTSEENGDTAVLTLTYSKVYENMYFSGADKTALTMFMKENESVFSSSGESLVPGDVTYKLTLNKKDESIISLEISRPYSFSAVITFINTLSQIGSTSLEITPVFSERYDFSYAGIEIENDVLTLTENGYDTLPVTPFTESELSEDEFSLKFSSSDPAVATVDENGQVTAIALSDKPVTVSVELSYLGKVFSDSCLVYVVKAVEKVNISEREITLKKGESKALTAEIVPDDATVKTVFFHSSDTDIAAVDNSGAVTAKNTGTAVITAYSEQGFISSECTVTVTE